MRTIRFRVDAELPPKKDGANSMWGKSPTEAQRLIALRNAAIRAMGDQSPLSRDIRLTLRVHVGAKSDRSAGDLDNYVTGVCDGLMAAHPRSVIHESFLAEELDRVHPTRAIAILDDSQVVSIRADKLVEPDEGPWYEIVLEGE